MTDTVTHTDTFSDEKKKQSSKKQAQDLRKRCGNCVEKFINSYEFMMEI